MWWIVRWRYPHRNSERKGSKVRCLCSRCRSICFFPCYVNHFLQLMVFNFIQYHLIYRSSDEFGSIIFSLWCCWYINMSNVSFFGSSLLIDINWSYDLFNHEVPPWWVDRHINILFPYSATLPSTGEVYSLHVWAWDCICSFEYRFLEICCRQQVLLSDWFLIYHEIGSIWTSCEKTNSSLVGP